MVAHACTLIPSAHLTLQICFTECVRTAIVPRNVKRSRISDQVLFCTDHAVHRHMPRRSLSNASRRHTFISATHMTFLSSMYVCLIIFHIRAALIGECSLDFNFKPAN